MIQNHPEVQSYNQNNTRFYKATSIIAMFVGLYMSVLVFYDLFSLYNGTDPMNMFHHLNASSNQSAIRGLAFQDITMNAPVVLLMAMICGPNLKTVFAKKSHTAS